jgi:hypothetical protein
MNILDPHNFKHSAEAYCKDKAVIHKELSRDTQQPVKTGTEIISSEKSLPPKEPKLDDSRLDTSLSMVMPSPIKPSPSLEKLTCLEQDLMHEEMECDESDITTLFDVITDR